MRCVFPKWGFTRQTPSPVYLPIITCTMQYTCMSINILSLILHNLIFHFFYFFMALTLQSFQLPDPHPHPTHGVFSLLDHNITRQTRSTRSIQIILLCSGLLNNAMQPEAHSPYTAADEKKKKVRERGTMRNEKSFESVFCVGYDMRLWIVEVRKRGKEMPLFCSIGLGRPLHHSPPCAHYVMQQYPIGLLTKLFPSFNLAWFWACNRSRGTTFRYRHVSHITVRW